MFADNGLDDGYETTLFFPGDFHQVEACVKAIFPLPGLRFLFTIRSKTPEILGTDGKPLYGEGYTFVPGKDSVVRSGSAGYIVVCVYIFRL